MNVCKLMNLRKQINVIVVFLLLFFTVACGETTKTNDTATDTTGSAESSHIADIIRNPITANEQNLDTSQLARMVFKEQAFDFGEVDAGAVLQHTFTFTNEGAVPLVISDVRSTCGCTVADWPRQPIMPGATGAVPVTFDTKNKNGKQNKPITITANTYPNKTIIHMNGRVFGKEKE